MRTDRNSAKRLHWQRIAFLLVGLVVMALAAAWLMIPDAARANLSDNLVGDWKFDEGTGTTAVDSSGTGNNGTIVRGTGTGSPAWVSPGRDGTGSALQFDGSGNPPQNDPPQNTVNVGNGASIDGMGRYILSMWVNFEPGYTDTGACGAEWTSLIGRTSSGVDWSYMLYINNTTGQLRAHNKQSNGVARSFDGATVVPTGQWVNLAQVADGNNIRTFVNGVEDASLTYDGTTQSLPTANTWIGQDPRGTCAINGTVDDVRVYDSFEAPGGVWGGLATWQKADDSTTTNGASWHDSSDNGNTVTQGTAGAQPTFQANGVNFNPALSFDGNDFMDYASNLGISGTNNFSTFIASQANSYVGNPVVFGYNMAGPSHMQFFNTSGAWLSSVGGENTCLAQTSTTLPAGTAGIGSFVRTGGATATVWLNGGGSPGAQSCLTNFDPSIVYRLGNRGTPSTNWFNGLLPEVIVYNRTLTDAERERVESYLAVKYGITLAHDYIASDGATTFWDRTANSGYNNDIAGIGRDDSGSLNQKQSKSVNEDSLVTIGNGTIAATNTDNTNDFANDLSFLLHGDNNGAAEPTTAVGSTSLTRLGRIWKTQETGTVGSVKLQIPATTLPGIQASLIRSTDEVFDSSDDIIPLTFNNKNYEADVDFNNGDYFTFAVVPVAPGGVSDGLEYWLRTDDMELTGGIATNWDDVYGWHTNEVFTGGANITLGDGFNFHDTARFNEGYLAFLNEQLLGGATAGEAFSMLQTLREPDVSSGYPYEFGGGLADAGWAYQYPPVDTPRLITGFGSTVRKIWNPATPASGPSRDMRDPLIFNELSRAGEFTARFNGLINYTTASNAVDFDSSNSGSTYIGAAHNSRFGDANLSEVIAYRRDLSQSERERVQSYMAITYGMTLGTTTTPLDYKASNESVFWTGSTTYQNDVAGIGRDDTSLLNQKQSRSENPGAFVTIGNGVIAADNESNPNNFASDRTFMMWGDDAGSIDVVNDIVQVSGTQLKRMERIWDIQETGTVGTVKLQIPQAELVGTSPKLLVSNDEIFDDTDQQITLTANGANYEADVNFTGDQFFTFGVDMVAPEVTTDPADSITQTSATLHGTLDDLGDFADADVFFRYRIVGSGDPFTETTPQTLNTPGAFSAPISGLTLDTQYEFKTVVQWQNAGTQESEGGLLSFVTDPAVAPDAPTNLQAVSAGTSQINLSWDAPTDEGGSPITGYKIERSLTGVDGWTTVVGDTGSTSTTYPDTGLDSNTEYFYRVSAINDAGTGNPSNISSATTDKLAPQATTDAATAIADTSATLNGTLNPPLDFTPVDVFFRYRLQGSADPFTETSLQQMTSPGAFNQNITGLDPEATYEFKTVVRWSDGSMQEAEGSLLAFTTLLTDGAPECDENNVDCFVNPVTGTNVILEVDESCTINTAEMKSETDLNISDPGFEYPTGLMNFTLDCGTPGYATTIKQYYFDTTNDGYILRKHNPNTDAYFTIEGATIEQTVLGGQTVTIVTYQATDGGELDIDGVPNGTIVDPVGLALSPDNSDLADTGQNIWIPASTAGLLVAVSLAIMRARRAAGFIRS